MSWFRGLPIARRSAASQRPGRGFPALRFRNYRLFFVGQFVSVTGTWMQTLAQSWLVLTLGGSAFDLGLVNVCQFAPILVFGLFGGVIADRVPKRNLLLVTQATSASLAAVLTGLVVSGNVQLWHVYALALGLGTANAFDMPTRQAFVSEMVDRDALMNAVALNSALFNAGRIVGPAIAGLLLAAFGPAVCFGLNAASYFAAITALAMMRLKPRPVSAAGSGFQRLREGLGYVRATPAVLLPMTMVGFVATFGMNFNVWLPLLSRDELSVGATGFGLLTAAMGVGSLGGALMLAVVGRVPRRGPMLGTAAALGGLLLVLAVGSELALPLPVIMAILAGAGFAMTTTMALANTTVQTTAPDVLRGRVMSVYMTIFAGTAPFGALIAGAAADRLAAPASVAGGGLVTLLAVATIAALSRRAGHRASPETVASAGAADNDGETSPSVPPAGPRRPSGPGPSRERGAPSAVGPKRPLASAPTAADAAGED